jgi:6-pyruvoyltetrahydropterin/6-carboxytetrahydropterin synthase
MKDQNGVHNRTVVDHVDHRHLNIEVPWLEGIIPTAENLARVFFERAAPELPDGVELVALTIHETERNSATYTPD